ncbi:MAG: cation:proton antiporter [Betaproteobacteria bacterium]
MPNIASQARASTNGIRYLTLGAVALACLAETSSALASDGGGHIATTFLWIGILLLLAKAAGLVERIGQPAVLGELLIGVVIGNLALLGLPTSFTAMTGALVDNEILRFLAEFGVVILLFQIGLESDVATMSKVGVPALLVACVGVAIPFALGTYVVGPWLLPELSFNGHLFLGATLTATSVGITGRVFQDLNVLRSREAQIVLGAAVIDDVIGLIILAVVSAIVTAGSVDVWGVIIITAKAVAFLAAALVMGRFAAPQFSRFFSLIHTGPGMKVAVLLATCLTFAWAAHAIGLAPIVGAFAAGLILDEVQFRGFVEPGLVKDIRESVDDAPARTRDRVEVALRKHEQHSLQHLMEPVGHLLVPLFFVYTGMQVKLATLFDAHILIVGAIITIVAFAGKLASGVVAGNVRKWVVGWGMAPRGEVGLIFAVAGKTLGVIPDDVFSMIIVVVILTTLLTPPILVATIKRSGVTD